MANEKVYLAVDLGASSGRVLAGLFDGQKIELEEAYRFENGPVDVAGSKYWDLLSQWSHVQEGLRSAGAKFRNQVASVGVDTWGVDYALLGAGDELLGNPYHYRDARTNGMMERAFEVVGRDAIFAETGLQFMQLNTLYQLLAMKESGSPLLEVAESFLMMPDLFHWLLTGEKSNEFTNATTTQFFNPQTGTWATSLLDRLGIPGGMLGEIVAPGTRLGRLHSDVASATCLARCEVVLPGTHDTASAVMAVPAAGEASTQPNWCYISSGTWSLMGVEVPQPVINDRCAALNFTNEGGVGQTIRLLKNIAGLWMVQECRRVWKAAGHDYTWDELVQHAREEPLLTCLINPDHGELMAPSDMAESIRDLCRTSGQDAPVSHGAVIRCALESLAMRYRMVLGNLEELTGGRIETIHIVGGGAQNKLLSQMAADATGRRVVTGPIEATALGNVMMQAVALGDVANIAQAREVIRASFAVDEFTPQNTAAWDEAYPRFEALLNSDR